MRDSLPPTTHPWHALSAADALERLAVSSDAGLADAEVLRRRTQYGPNALPEPPRRGLLAVFAQQLRSPLIGLLLIAAATALALGERGDAAVILIVVVLNAAIGTFQEGRAEHALAALRRVTGVRARVVRDRSEQVIDATEIVPGDVLLVAAGDAVAADARLLEAAGVEASEAALTGESTAVRKSVQPCAPDTILAERGAMLFAGTQVTAGRARAVVVGTGLHTEVGRIAAMAEATRPPKTPLERRIAAFGRSITLAAFAVFALIIALGLARQLPFAEILMLGISQLVGMVPEGLPVAMTIALAVGVQRMARRGAIVRKLGAVEVLGSTTVICADKTGTLTRNEMTVTAVGLPGAPWLDVEVTGTGYTPHGTIRPRDRRLEPLLAAALLCNDADLTASADAAAPWRALGDPTEAALVALAMKGGLAPARLRQDLPRRRELPFDPATKMMATEHATPSGPRVFVKGAPEEVFALCSHVAGPDATVPFDERALAAARACATGMAGRALRVLAFAQADGLTLGDAGFVGLRGKLTLLGIAGAIDPPRPEVSAALAACRAAGIRPVMITGDHEVTARAVAQQLGVALDGEGDGDALMHGRELERLSQAELHARMRAVSVFARVHPAQKLRIVEGYQQSHEVVAMTGDGVNDAPALMRADVGVAMGRAGTDVAKEAAKIVITDDNFATIVAAVEEGRVVYRNLKKAVLLLCSTSLAEVLVLLGAIVLGYPPPFAAVQILWNNLVTEGVITVNLVMDPPEGDEMAMPPVPAGEPLLSRGLLERLLLMSATISLVALGWFVVRLEMGVAHAVAQAEAFTLLAACEWYNVLNCRSERASALTLGVLKNPWLVTGLVVGIALQAVVLYLPQLNSFFYTTALSASQVLAIVAAGSLVLWLEELRKLWARRRYRA